MRLTTAPAELPEESNGQVTLLGAFSDADTSANLSAPSREYLSVLTTDSPDENQDLSRAVWLHALAIIYSPLYLSENAAGMRSDWPRIPFPDTLAQLHQSAQMGAALGKLL